MIPNTVIIFVTLTLAHSAPILEDKNLNTPDFNPDVGEYGEYFEGDILLTSEQQNRIFEAVRDRNGLLSLSKRWPNRTVVYYIEKDDFDDEQIEKIEEGMRAIENISCIKFYPRKEKSEHAVIIKGTGSGCFANVGYLGSDIKNNTSQNLNLEYRCFQLGTIVHEMLHTLGFYHMQSTFDRDDYVKIIHENIIDGLHHNFAKYSNDTVTDFGVPYDYGSLMHYNDKAFSKNGEKTIVPLKEHVSIGQRKGMSDSDILKLNKMYCEEKSHAK